MDAVVLDGRYRLGDVLGRGGMADVYRADDLLLGRSVAVKVFRFDGDDSSERIDSEIRTLAGLNHPGLVALYDATFDDRPYLVMELVDGPTIRSAGPLQSPDELVRYATELAETVAYIHSRGVVHRDIKPANIILGSPRSSAGRYSTKLADFGIARFLDGARLTAHGATIGTAHYISPEQATGRPVTTASDIYSLGLVLIECQTGRMAFGGDAISAAVARLHRDPEVPTEWGSAWSNLLTAMTARDPGRRPTAIDVVSALHGIAAGETRILPVAQRSWVRRRVIAGALAAVLALVLAAFVLTRESDPSGAVVQPTTTVVESAAPTAAAEPPPSSVPTEVPVVEPIPTPVPAPVVETAPVVTASVEKAAPMENTAPVEVTAPPNGNNGTGNGNGGNSKPGNGNGNGGNSKPGNGNGNSGNGNGNNGNGNGK